MADDLSEKKEQEHFADRIAEEILNLMSRAPALRVIAERPHPLHAKFQSLCDENGTPRRWPKRGNSSVRGACCNGAWMSQLCSAKVPSVAFRR